MPPRRAAFLDAAADDAPGEALRGALAEAERAASALLAAASAARARDVDPVEEASLLRRADALAVTLQRARLVMVRDALLVLPLALPNALVHSIWASLPVEVRLRCREVCYAWRDALNELRLWTQLDLTGVSGVVARVTPTLLLAASARAGGQLRRLHVTQAASLHSAVLAVIADDANTLRLLRLTFGRGILDYYPCNHLETLLRAAPRQCVVEADAFVDRRPRTMLRNEPPFQALRLRWLRINGARMRANDVVALAAELAAHSSLRKLTLRDMSLNTLTAPDAIVDAALTLRLNVLVLNTCRMEATSAVALSRLLRCTLVLRELAVLNVRGVLLDTHAVTLLADALRGNRTLTSLHMYAIDLWRDMGAAAVLLGALTGHASLACIALGRHGGGDAENAAAGALLAALVAANSMQLRELDVGYNRLGEVGLGPLVDALPHNTHLRKLYCVDAAEQSAAFERKRLLPALAANTSLRLLSSGYIEADAFVYTAACNAARVAAAAARD